MQIGVLGSGLMGGRDLKVRAGPAASSDSCKKDDKSCLITHHE